MANTKNGIYYPNDYTMTADVPEDMKKMANSIDTKIETLKLNTDLIEKIAIKPVANGKTINIKDGVNAKPLYFDVEGNSIQNGVPTPDTPQEVECVDGYNLLDNELTTGEINGLSYKINDDKSITLNGTTTGNVNLVINAKNIILNGDYTFYLFNKNNKINLQGVENGETVAYLPYGTNNEKITKKYVNNTILSKVFSYIGTGKTFNNETFKYMMIKGTEQKTYLPYGNIRIKDTGKNLFDKTKVSAGAIKEDGSLYDTGDVFFTTDFIKINPNSSYSKTETGSPRIKLFDKNKEVISTSSFSDIANFRNAGTYKIPFKTAEYIRFTYNTDSIPNDMLQFEEGTKQTGYEPHKETQVNIDLEGNELCKIGETKDLLHIDSNGKTIIEKRFAKYVFTGEEDWKVDSQKKVYGTYINDMKKFKASELTNALSNMYKATFLSICRETPNTFCTFDVGVWFNNTGFNDINSWKQFLKDKYNSGNPVYVIYELVTPQTIELADTNITLYEGVNNVELLSNIEPSNIQFQYIADTETYINNKINSAIENIAKTNQQI